MKQWTVFAAGFALAAVMFGAPHLFAAEEPRPVQAKPVFSEKLPNVPGKTLTGVLVKYAAGAKSPSHAHAGSVFAYVLSGKVRSENSVTGPARVYEAGEGFFELVDVAAAGSWRHIAKGRGSAAEDKDRTAGCG